MQLSDTLFETITSTVRGGPDGARDSGAPDPAAVDQRRREPRVGVRARVTVIPIGDGLRIAPFEVPLRDLSSGGIGFEHSSRMSLDEQFVVLLPGGGESVAVLCRVAHYQPLAEQAFAIGARFVRVLNQPGSVPAGGTIGFPRQSPVPRRAAS
jgi:hypothetical protein